MKVRYCFKKTVYGYAETKGSTREECDHKFDMRDFDDEFDNKSDYEWGETEEVEE